MSENPNSLSEFELALQGSLGAKDVRVGDVIEGTIAAIHGDVVLVDISGKSEAVLSRDELDELGTGDPVEVVIVSDGDEVRVSRRLAVEMRLKEKLSVAADSGEPVEGKVVGRRKGGFDVTMAGIRGFCPLSHIDDSRSDDLDQHLGQVYSFRVLEYEADGRKLVVSRAVLIREERDRLRKEAWERLEEGAVVGGTVRSLTDFGAFVDLGGVDGLVHVTELSRRRVGHPREVLAVGQDVEVKILELDPAKQRISLSIKELEDDPWEGASDRYPARSAFEGRIVRKAAFGVFVELQPGLDGLLHISQLPPGLELDAPELEEGETLSGWVKELDVDAQRIGLTLRQLPDHDPWERIEMRYPEGKVVDGIVENGAAFGVFVELEPGVSALIPVVELGMGREVDAKTAMTPGQPVTAKIMSVDPERRRISLSVRAHKRDEERSEYMQHMESATETPTVSGFGQQLMDALGKKKA